MPDERDDREDRDGLFEDLDRFFAPVNDVTWPEDEPAAAPAVPPAIPPAPFVSTPSPVAPSTPGADDALDGDEGDEVDELVFIDEGYPAFDADDVPTVDIRADAAAEPGAGEDADDELAALFGPSDEEADESDEAVPAPGPLTHEPAPGVLSLFDETASDEEDARWDTGRREPDVPDVDVEVERESARVSDDRPSWLDDEDDDGVVVAGAAASTPEEPSQSPYVDLPPLLGRSLADEPDDEGPLLGVGSLAAGRDPFAGIGDDPDIRVTTTGSGGGADLDEEFHSIGRLLGEVEGDGGSGLFGGPMETGPIGGLDGPSWQDATSIAVGTEPERRSGRNLPLALLTGVLLAGAALATLWIGRAWFALFAGAAVVLAQGEYYAAVRHRGYRPATAVGLAGGALISAAAYLRGEAAMVAMLGLTVLATYLWFMVVPAERRRDVVRDLSVTLFGVISVPLLAGFLFALLRAPGGEPVVISVIGLTIAYDTAAFFTGYLWGRRPLAPSVSPKKSWEGAIGGTLFVLAIAIGVVASSVPALNTVGAAAGLGLVVSLLAPLGDLAESLVKRDLGLKDMGSILPGHGGIYDRIDALLFVAPGALLYLRFLVG